MPASNSNRIASIDILRGIIMIIMALDHTRDFFHITAMTADPLDPASTSIAIFFTRWITHFCAPVFTMLAGLSAYLSSQKRSGSKAGQFLIKRGLWLVLVEVVLISFALSFNPFYNFIILTTIWAIGWSMVILGLLKRFSYPVILVTGIILFFGHNIIDYVSQPPPGTASAYLLSVLLTSRAPVIPLNANHVIGFFYAILPWTGIMLLGYCLGPLFQQGFPAERRKRMLIFVGSSLVLLFIVLRSLKGYGDPGAFSADKNTLLSFLNTSKYPPSLQYACMTLGPALILLALLDNIQGGWTKIVSVYGRVPFFYYVLHLYLLHSLLVLVFFITAHTTAQINDPRVPFLFRPSDFGYSLTVVYLIWLTVVAALYRPCRWFSKYRAQHNYWWLKYV